MSDGRSRQAAQEAVEGGRKKKEKNQQGIMCQQGVFRVFESHRCLLARCRLFDEMRGRLTE